MHAERAVLTCCSVRYKCSCAYVLHAHLHATRMHRVYVRKCAYVACTVCFVYIGCMNMDVRVMHHVSYVRCFTCHISCVHSTALTPSTSTFVTASTPFAELPQQYRQLMIDMETMVRATSTARDEIREHVRSRRGKQKMSVTSVMEVSKGDRGLCDACAVRTCVRCGAMRDR